MTLRSMTSPSIDLDPPWSGPTPRLVATDLDGTLLRPDGTISERTGRVLAALDRRGIPVVFVTARPLRWMDELWPWVGQHGLAIVSNGAIIRDVANDRLDEVHGIDRSSGLELVAAITAALPQATYALEDVTGIRIGTGFVEPGDVPDRSPSGDLVDIWVDEAVKLMVRAPGVAPDRLRQRVIDSVAQRAVVTWSGDGLMEISAPGVTKAAALARIAARLQVAAVEVVAFGDMPNDLPMLTWAGSAVAVANADPAVLAVADRVTASHQDDGVAAMLELVFGPR